MSPPVRRSPGWPDRPGQPVRPTCVPADSGSAVVEFLVVGTLMLLPLVALVVGVSRVQAAAFAVDAGARSAALAVAGGAGGGPGGGPGGAADGQGVADAAVALALADQGFDGAAAVAVTCDDGCGTPGARVGVQVRYDVELPSPPLLGAVLPQRVPLDGSATATVDRFAPAPGPAPAGAAPGS